MSLSFSPLSPEIGKSDSRNLNSMDEDFGLRMITGWYLLPKVSEDKPMGEDAYFISYDEQTIGVADGVGGWAKYGIDSGVYARRLMGNASQSAEDNCSISGGGVDPMTVLKEAFEKTEAEGASTACIVSLRDGFLHAVNLGDSGFMVIRSGEIVYRSPVQQSYFNCPFQLGGGNNTPSEADEIIFEVQEGDAIVAATDGLFDNVLDSEIEFLVQLSLDVRASPDKIADLLCHTARKISLENDAVTPFTIEAAKAGWDWEEALGGKYDDVTVVVGYVVTSSFIPSFLHC